MSDIFDDEQYNFLDESDGSFDDSQYNFLDEVEQTAAPQPIGRTQTLLKPEDFANEDAMGSATKAALETQAEGGPTAYADNGSFGNWLKNLWNAVSYNSSGKVTARNTAMNNQDILRGTVRKGGKDVPLTELDDSELDYLADAAGWNGAPAYFKRFLGKWARSEDGIMQRWDRETGANIADPVERKKARVKYAQDIARENVQQQEWEKQVAQVELKNRLKAFGSTAGSGLITNGAYMLPYIVPGAHGFLAGVIEGADRSQELMADKYVVAPDGNIYVGAERDSTGKALAKGAARGAIAPLIETVGGEPVANGVGALAKTTLGRLLAARREGDARVPATPCGGIRSARLRDAVEGLSAVV